MTRWMLILSGLLLASPALPDTVTREKREGPDRISASAVLAAAPETVLRVLERPCHVRQWMPGLTALRVLDHPAPGQTRVYMAHAGRWPLAPRDAVTLFEQQRLEERILIRMRGQPEHLPPQPGHVRIPFNEGLWELTRRKDGSTRVNYQQQVSPGGLLPQNLSDMAAVRHVRATMEALKGYVEDSPDPDCPADHDRDMGGYDPLP